MSRRRSLGCNEIIFNPLVKWWRDGPISRQLRGFVWSRAPVHYKIGMMACEFDVFSFSCFSSISFRKDMFSYCKYFMLSLVVQAR